MGYELGTVILYGCRLDKQGVFAPHPMTPEEARAAFGDEPATWRFGRLDQTGLFPQRNRQDDPQSDMPGDNS